MSQTGLSSVRDIDITNTYQPHSTNIRNQSSTKNSLLDRPLAVSRNRSSSLFEQPRKQAHAVVDTVKLVFQDEPEVLETRTIQSVERTQNENGQVILRTIISIHYVGHTDKHWPSWPWSKSPVMHEEMPQEMNGLYQEDQYRLHLQESNQILRRYIFNRYPKMLLTLLFVLLVIFIIVIRTLYVWKTAYFAWVFAFALVFFVLIVTMRTRAWMGMKKLKKLEREWNEESDHSVKFHFNSIDFLYFVRLFITVESQDKETMDVAHTKYIQRNL
ncbi:hypothetical protein BGW37DRAFT_508038 [Umbelopsis sp. PMI_123]|nr:hypothetical protein BGW37DRAFT_508038 [Umbelopsis sp. PMI_123]